MGTENDRNRSSHNFHDLNNDHDDDNGDDSPSDGVVVAQIKRISSARLRVPQNLRIKFKRAWGSQVAFK